MPEEILDLVNEHDAVIGQLPRAEIYRRKLPNFRVVNAFIRDDQNRVWIPTRSANKTLYPLHLDVSVGGHVAAGEHYDEALLREAEEEAALELTPQHVTRIAYLTPKDGVSAFMWLYEIRGVTPQLNPNDFVSAQWLSLEALQHKVNTEPVKGDLPRLLEYLT